MREVSGVLMALLRGPQCEVSEILQRSSLQLGPQSEVSEVLVAVLSYNPSEVKSYSAMLVSQQCRKTSSSVLL